MKPEPHLVNPNRAIAATTLLLEAWRGRQPSPELVTEAEPRSLSEAFAVQEHVARSLGVGVAGWKAAVTPDAVLFAPIYASLAYASPARIACSFGLPLVAEVEIAFRLREDLSTESLDKGCIRRAVGEVLIGIELVQSRLPDHASRALPWFLADNLGNAGYIAGTPSIDDLAIEDLPLLVTVDGTTVWEAPSERRISDLFDILARFTRAIDGHLGGLRRGQFVTTGHLCGTPFAITQPAVIRAATRFGTVEVAITHSN
jgi:2-keto-4-pentenoate hydratase